MARRSDHTRDELGSLVLKAATRIIADQGLDGLSVRGVAAEVGCSSGSIYNVFSNLDDLISSVNAQTMNALADALEQVELTGDALDDITRIMRVYLAFQEQHEGLWGANIRHAGRQDIQQPEIYLHSLSRVIDRVGQALAPAFGSGRPDGATFAVRVLWASLLGISSIPASARFLGQQNATRDMMAENLVRNYVRGLLADRDSGQ